MKTIGLLGGTTWISTIDYYKVLNQETNRQLGKNHSAKVILYSINFEEAMQFKKRNDFEGFKNLIVKAAINIENAGADCLLLGANTIHMFSDQVIENVKIPLIHIAKETAKAILAKGLNKVSLLGTRTTMMEDFYKSILLNEGIETIIPEEKDMDFIDHNIFFELGKNIFKEESKQRYLNIIDKQVKEGAQGVILGCTEIPLLIKQKDSEHPLFNTLDIHAKAAVDFALNEI